MSELLAVEKCSSHQSALIDCIALVLQPEIFATQYEREVEKIHGEMVKDGVPTVNSEACETIEDTNNVNKSYELPSNAVQSESNQKYNLLNSCLVSVPENELLLHVDPLVHLDTVQPGVEQHATNETLDTSSESNNASIRAGGFSQIRQADPLTTKQQVSLWLTRISSQDVHQECSMNSLKSLVNSGRKSQLKKSLLASNKKGSQFVSKKHSHIKRNLSTRSLKDLFMSQPRDQECDPNIRKCETVLALSQDVEDKCTMDHFTAKRFWNKYQCSSSQICQTTSKTSLLKQFPRHGSGVFPRTLKIQNTAPGGLSGLQPLGESLQNFPGLTPVNRLRSTLSNLQCSRCTSVLSVATSKMTSRASSQISLLLDKRYSKSINQEDPQCKICLCDCPSEAMVTLEECRCSFCKECLKQYVTFEIMNGSYDISCPDPACPTQGVVSQQQMETLTDKELLDKYRTFRLNTEVSLDAARTWCPSSACNTICDCSGSKYQGVAVTCPTCVKEFCSLCSATWHAGLSCQENGALLVMQGREGEETDAFPWGSLQDNIKRCPMCNVPIERDAGCAQMMCKRCKHVFCWFCLESLDGDFLLRHYDSGSCQGKLGHSRSSVIFHRVQVIGIFAAFGILLLVASPLILAAAPVIICCKCRSCRKTVQMEQETNIS